MKLYRGSRRSQDTLYPQSLPEGDVNRFPEGVTQVVFATDDSTEAAIYAIFSQQNLGYWQSGKDDQGKWHVSLPMNKRELESFGEEDIFVYEIDDEAGIFQKPLEGDEYYATVPVIPNGCEVRKIKDVIAEWQKEGKVEFYFQKSETEKERLVG